MSTNEEQGQGNSGGSGGALTTREEFAGVAIETTGEVASRAAMARVRAQVEARFVMAVHRPRSFMACRQRLLEECKRPQFAPLVRYRKPQGKVKNEKTGQWEDNFVEGPSIRFVEAALRSMMNMGYETVTIADDEDKRVVRVEVTDYEAVAFAAEEVVVAKTIERSKPRPGDEVLSKRQNTKGEWVYRVVATEAETTTRVQAAVSKALRNAGLRLLPRDLVDEAQAAAMAVLRAEVKADPLAARKRLVDNFAELRISVDMLSEYLGGKPIEDITDDELLELRLVGACVKTGENTWREVLEASPYREAPPAAGGEEGKANPAAALREKLQGRLADAQAKKKGTTPAPGQPAGAAAPGGAAPAQPGAPAPVVPPPATAAEPPAPAPVASAGLDEGTILEIASEAGVSMDVVAAVAGLDAEGRGVPYIMKFRKDAIGGADEATVALIVERVKRAGQKAKAGAAVPPREPGAEG